jgi:hypothetical protein
LPQNERSHGTIQEPHQVDPEAIIDLMQLCGRVTICRLLGWTLYAAALGDFQHGRFSSDGQTATPQDY